jgi:transposase
MRGQAGFWDIDERYVRLSEAGDPLEKLNGLVPWDVFRKPLAKALKRSDGAKGGRPPYDAVLMFKIMVLQALYGLSDDQAEFQIQDRLSFMRFLGLGLGDAVPDAKTIWLFREHLTQAGAVENLFARFDKHLARAGYLAMGGQIVDATIVAAPKQRNTDAEKADIKAGKVPDEWAGQAGEAAPEGSRCTLDDKVLESQGGRRWKDAAARHRHSRLRLQESCRDRSEARLHPRLERHRRVGL